MPILKLVQDTPGLALEPSEVADLTAAYEKALVKLGVTEDDDLVAQLVAERIVSCARQGERDPQKLLESALALPAKLGGGFGPLDAKP